MKVECKAKAVNCYYSSSYRRSGSLYRQSVLSSNTITHLGNTSKRRSLGGGIINYKDNHINNNNHNNNHKYNHSINSKNKHYYNNNINNRNHIKNRNNNNNNIHNKNNNIMKKNINVT